MNPNRMKMALTSIMAVSIAVILLFGGCSDKKEEKVESKSMEQIRKEEGIPVQVSEIKPEKFEKVLTFFAKLSGIKETTKYSAIADRIVKINAKVGDFVKEGQVVVEFPTDNPSLQFEQAKIAYDNAKKTYDRMKALLEAGETSQQNYDNVNTQYLVSKQNYQSLKQMVMIEAPASGVIAEMFVKNGDDVDGHKPLFTVSQLQTMVAKFWVTEEEVRQLRVGMPAAVISSGEEFSGRVTEVALSMDEFRRAFGIEVQCPNPSRKLKSGVTADVKLSIYSKPDAIVIPRRLVKSDNGKEYVYIEKDGRAEIRYIKTGDISGIDVEVIEGLNAGDRLITKGDALVSEGAALRLSAND